MPTARRTLRPDVTPLRTAPGFRLLFASRTITAFGAQATDVAVLVFGLYGDVLADRFDRRTLMRWCEVGLGGTAALLLANALLPHPATWPLYALTAVMAALV